MSRAAGNKKDIKELEEMAARYGVQDNALFKSTLDRYITQQRVIDSIKRAIDEDDVTVTMEYVKGRENAYMHPAVKELPRHADSANKTADMLLKIIMSLGDKNHDIDALMDDLEDDK